MSEHTTPHDITFSLIVNCIRRNGRKLLMVLSATSVLTLAVMAFIPDYYRSDEIVGYEEVTSTVAHGLHNVGVALGFNLGDVHKNTDAIFPPHYLLLMRSEEFMARLMAVQVLTKEGERKSYFAHVTGHSADTPLPDPFRLTDEERKLFDQTQKRILCAANTRKNLVKVSVMDRDPMVCAVMADSVRACLQQYLMDYRQRKSQAEADYFKELTVQAQTEYDQALGAFTAFAEQHLNLEKGSLLARQEKLQNEMLLKYRTLQALQAQYNQAVAKVEDRTAVFTMVQKAFVPPTPVGPRRGYMVLVLCLLAFIFSLLFFLRRDLIGQLTL